MTFVQLDKIQPKFRHLVDLLMFSNRMDIDLQNLNTLLYDNYQINLEFLLDRFKKSCEIFWEDNESFWINRLSFLFNLNNKIISNNIEKYLEKRMFSLVRTKQSISEKHDLAYIQFIAYCKVRYSRKESLLSVKNYLTELPSHVNADKLIKIVSSFIPIVFKDMNEYAMTISHKIIYSSRNFEILQSLEGKGIVIDRKPLVKLAKEILIERERSSKNILAFFSLLNDQKILNQLKTDYTLSDREFLLDFISNCDYQIIEEYHLKNIKNIITLDECVANDVAIIYINKLYSRRVRHKRSNIDKIIRLLNIFPEISSKRILAHLSSKNKISDIKYMMKAFPNLQKLAIFI